MQNQGTIKLFQKQKEAYFANTPIVVYAGGIQSGKTTVGAAKCNLAAGTFKAIDDNFIVCTPTYKILKQATLPKFLALNNQYGEYLKGDMEFHWHNGGTTFFRTATEPDCIEGITNVQFVWGDEAGLFSKYFWGNMLGRAAFKQAQIFLTTTPYALNWLAELVRDAELGRIEDTSVIHCKSIDSPYFPKEEYDRQKTKLDSRRFQMKYDGKFGQMEGLVYDIVSFCSMPVLPDGTKFYGGIDWGYYPDPFALTIRAVLPDGMQYRIGEFYKNRLTPSEIVRAVESRHRLFKFQSIICDPSDPKMISELQRKQLPAVPGDNAITMGIQKHYELMKAGKFKVVEETNPYGKDEYVSYHYPEKKELTLDQSLATRDTLPVDKDNHGLDADRYVTMYLDGRSGEKIKPTIPGSGRGIERQSERIKRLKSGKKKRYEEVS